MPLIIDEALVRLGLDNNLSGPLAAAVAEAEAEIEALGHKQAKIKVDVDTAKAKAELDELKAKLKELEEQKKLETAASKQGAEEDKKAARQRLKDINDELKGARELSKAAEKEYKDRQRVGQVTGLVSRDMVRQLGDESKAQQKLIKDVQAANKIKTEAAKAESARVKQAATDTRNMARLQDQAYREDATRTKQKLADSERLRTAGVRAAQEAAKEARLQQTYAKQAQKVQDLTGALKGKQGQERIIASLDSSRAIRDMAVTRAELEAMGKKPVEIKADVNTKGLKGKLAGLFGGGRGSGLEGDSRMIRNLGNEIASAGQKLNKAKLNIGPISATARTWLIAFSALAPVISGVVGAAGSLISVLGAGLGGAMGVGAAAATGFGMAFVGILSNVVPFVTGLKQASTYTKALTAAQTKYGEGSKQAKAAQKALNNDLKSATPVVRQTVEGFTALRTEWQKSTKGIADKNIGNIVGAAFKTVHADMGFFAKDTNQAFTEVSGGFSKWMAGLRGASAQRDLNNIFGNANRSIAPLMSGLGSLGTAFRSITSSFSNFLPGLSQGFAGWAKNIADAAQRSGGFAKGVHTMVDAMRSLGHFSQATGRFLLTFFKAGVGPGVGLVKNMTDGMNNLSKSMNTVAGQQRLHNFFQRSVDTTKELWGALKPLVSSFVQFGQVTAPIANAMLRIVAAISKVIMAFTNLKVFGTRPIIDAFGLLAAVGLIGKLTAGMRELIGMSGRFGKNVFSFGKDVLGGGNIKNAFNDAFRGGGVAGPIEAAMVSGGEAAGATIGGAMESAGAAAAAEIGGAMSTGGAAAAGEQVAAGAATAGEQLAIPGLEAAGVGAAATSAEVAGVGAAATGSAAAVTGLGAAMAALPVLGVAAGILGLGGALLMLTANNDTAAKSTANLKDELQQVHSIKGIQRTAAALPSVRDASAPAVANQAGDLKAVNAAQAQYNRLVAEGAQNTQRGRDSLANLNSAIVQQQSDQTEANQAVSKAHGLHQQLSDDLQNKVGKAYTDLTKNQDLYNKANDRYQHFLDHGVRKSSELKSAEEARNNTLNNLNKSQAAYNEAQRRASMVQNQLITDNINAKRVQEGMPVVLNTQAQAVGRLGKAILAVGGMNATKAFNFVVHTPNPADLVKISNLINNLSPKNKSAAITVLANTKTAADALKVLNSIKLQDKTMKVTAKIGDIISTLARIQGIKLTPKEQHLLQTGGPNVLAQIAKINGIQLPKKVLKLLGDAQDAMNKHHQVEGLSDVQKALKILGQNQGAMSAISAVIGALAAVTDKSVTVTVTGVLTGNMKAFQGWATGGMLGVPGLANGGSALEATKARAAMEAGKRQVEQTKGGVYSKPQYLVGEENKPEFVIATNPLYRRENLRYLKMAAQSLGANVIAAATGFSPMSRRHGHEAAKPRGAGSNRLPKGHPRGFQGLPPKDRLGGIDTSDIDTAVSNTSSAVSDDNTKLTSQNTKITSTEKTIFEISKIAKKKRTAREKTDLAYAQSHIGGLRRTKHGILQKTANDKATLKKYKALQSSAQKTEDDFTSLENQITSVQGYRDAAVDALGNASTSSGFNPNNHDKWETNSWVQWNKILGNLEKQHTEKLKKTFNDVKNAKLPKGANRLKFLSALEAAIGQSIGAETTDEQAEAPTAPTSGTTDVPGKTKTVGDITYNYPEALSDFLDVYKLSDQLSWLNVGMTNAQIAEAASPGDPGAFAAEQGAAKALSDFYGGVYGQTQAWRNPVTGGLDPGLINEAGQAFLAAQQTYTGLANPGGPTSGQLASTALSSLYTQYGGNAASTLLGVANNRPPATTGVAAAMAGGDQAESALETQSTSRVATHATVTPPTVQTQAQPSHTVNNYFSHPPADPHTWSKSIQWELNS